MDKTTSIMELDMSEDGSEEDLGAYESGSDVEGGSVSGESKSDDFDEKNWGRRKSSYYKRAEESGDEDSEDEAVAEEAEARRLQKQKASERRDDDFDDSFATRSSAQKTSSHSDNKGGKSLTSTDAGLLETMYKEMGQFQTSLSSSDPSFSSSTHRDLSSLSRQEKLDLVTKDSPELLLLLDSFNAKMKEIREKLAPLIQRARDQQIPTSKGISYLETKYHLLLNYCTNICFYLLLKAEGKSVKNHPVIDHLARTRTVIDRLKPLDQKLKYQIDKLLKLAAQGEANMQSDPKLRHRANIKGFMPVGGKDEENGMYGDDADDGAMDSDDMDVDEDGEMANGNKYVAPKFAPTGDHEEKRKIRAEKKAKSSAMAEYLIEQFGDRPLEHSTGVGTRDKSLKAAQLERERYEEDNFVRLGLTKKEKKATRKASVFVDEFADLADYGDLKALDRADALHMAEDLESKAFSSSSKKRRHSSTSLLDDDAHQSTKSGMKDKLSSIMDSIDKRAEASASAKVHRYGVDEDIDYDGIKQEKKAKKMKLREDREKAEGQHLIDMERRAKDQAKQLSNESGSGTTTTTSSLKSKKTKKTDYSEMAEAMDGDDDFYKEAVAAQKAAKEEKMATSRAARSERKKDRDELAATEAADAAAGGDGKRRASKLIQDNRGLRKSKKKELHNSRVVHKEKYKEALKKLKSRGATGEATSQQKFSGSASGINRRVVRSTQL
jgi:hypothetical protein